MEIAGAIVTLLGFLGLIAGLLVQWCKDRSCEDEPSVYSVGD